MACYTLLKENLPCIRMTNHVLKKGFSFDLTMDAYTGAEIYCANTMIQNILIYTVMMYMLLLKI